VNGVSGEKSLTVLGRLVAAGAFSESRVTSSGADPGRASHFPLAPRARAGRQINGAEAALADVGLACR
jgi:hypothetical protein